MKFNKDEHKVRTFHRDPKSKKFSFIDRVFHSLSHAVEFLENVVCDAYKLFDRDNCPISHRRKCDHHHHHHDDDDTYA